MIANTPKNISVLMVEDGSGDATLIRSMLSEETSVTFQVTWVKSLKEAIGELIGPNRKKFDISLWDLALPDSPFLKTLTRIGPFVGKTPFLVVTGFEYFADHARALGAKDVLIKGRFQSADLLRSIEKAVHSEA